MRKVLLCTVALLAPAVTAAQTARSPVAGNVTLVSDYRFRGIDQTFRNPALQGGFDYIHSSGVYLGNWNSNVSQGAGYPAANLEMDFYGGYKRAIGNLGFDVGLIHYSYPGSDAGPRSTPVVQNNRTLAVHSGAVGNTEFYVGGAWRALSLKYFHVLGDYFSIPDTGSTSYVDAAVTFDLGNGWAVNSHYGHLDARGANDRSYSDWRIGATKDLSGWILGAAYVGTNAKGDCALNEPYCYSNGNGGVDDKRRDAGRGTLVLSVGKAF